MKSKAIISETGTISRDKYAPEGSVLVDQYTVKEPDYLPTSF